MHEVNIEHDTFDVIQLTNTRYLHCAPNAVVGRLHIIFIFQVECGCHGNTLFPIRFLFTQRCLRINDYTELHVCRPVFRFC